MIEEPLKAFTSDLDPLVISAPTIRSGTTLLQRLLCSSRKALIYGEPCAQDLEIFLNFYTLKSKQYDCRQAEVSTALAQVLSGNVNDWIPTLMPDISEYLQAIGKAAFAGLNYCRDFALQVERPCWGFKYPGWAPATIRLMRDLMPRARFIFIHRELADCLKSAKSHGSAFGWTFSKADVEQFCRSWVENSHYMLSLDGEATVLSLRFEELVVEPQIAFRRIAEFTGVDDTDPKVLQRKINAWIGEGHETRSKDGYLRPAELDEFDFQVIESTRSLAAGQPSAY